MRILIVGSKGFIGHHLGSYFEARGHDVWGADIIEDYSKDEKYFTIDASNSDFGSVMGHIYYDVCINCSGAASVPDSIIYPLRDYFLNTVNVFKLLEAIRHFQPSCKFLNLSSAAVYGNPQLLPISEDTPTLPLSPYGLHKLYAEQICAETFNFYGVRTCSVRIFSVYGPGLKKQLFWDIYKKVKSGKSFTLFGTGEESRDFINIVDLQQAISLIIEFSEFNGNIINVANGQEIRIKDAVSIFVDLFNLDIEYSFSGGVRVGDPVNWKADITKLQSMGYRQEIELFQGLKMYYEWVTGSSSNQSL